jgi:hypothetical protein
MLIVETLHRTGHLDPAALLNLPQEWQMLHLAHTRSWLIGRYDPQPATERRPGRSRTNQPSNAAAEAAAIAELRKGPRPQDVAAARRLLATTGAPERLRRAAQATLSRAAGATP